MTKRKKSLFCCYFFCISFFCFLSLDSSNINQQDYYQYFIQSNPGVYRTGLIFHDPETDPSGIRIKEVQPVAFAPRYIAKQTNSLVNLNYLPPVNSQGSQGSCVAWATGYYYKTYQENKEAGRTNPTEKARASNICSPAFIYNLIHIKDDGGSYFSDAFRVLNDFGCASLNDFPYNDQDYQTWPTEAAFNAAIPRRTTVTSGEYYWLMLDSDSALNQLKQRLLNGDIAVFGIYVYNNFYQIQNYNNIYSLADKTGTNQGGHAQTIVGYDDTIVTPDGTGAFRVVNSWGTNWGDAGFYWISYQAIKYGSALSQGYAFWVDDRNNYSSDKKAIFRLTHQYSRETEIWVSAGGVNIYFFDFLVNSLNNEYRNFPTTNIVLDVKDLAAYLTPGAYLYLYMRDKVTNSTGGRIDYLAFSNGVQSSSPVTPVNINDGSVDNAWVRIPTGNEPMISLNRRKLNFGATANSSNSIILRENAASQNTSAQSFYLSNSGGGTLDWTITDNATWLSCNPLSGIGNATITCSVDASGLAPGDYSATITISSQSALNSPQTIQVSLTVYSSGSSSPPFGVMDTPVDGSSGIEGSIPVTGWALDDIEVSKVEIKRDPHPLDPPVVIGADGLVFVGDAVFVEGARPDVETAFPTFPMGYRAGWGYMLLTNFLPNQGTGTYTLHAIAYDKEGRKVEIGTKTFISDNANATLPFGTIDTPAQGGEASGANYVNFAWALTPQPKFIPTDGSTLLVWIDGLPQSGHPTYNQYRVDIATLFPGYANSNGAVGLYFIDTTKLSNGVHTIAWSVVDSASKTTGIGSRYFRVMNTGGITGSQGSAMSFSFPTPSEEKRLSRLSEISFLPQDKNPIYIRKGYELDSLAEPAFNDKDGWVTVSVKRTDRLEIVLDERYKDYIQGLINISKGPYQENDAFLSLPGKQKGAISEELMYGGYLVVRDELRPLPIGSSFDPQKGIFAWLPGPAFFGEYRFVFVKRDSLGFRTIKKIVTRLGE